jgi:hypothetical protein
MPKKKKTIDYQDMLPVFRLLIKPGSEYANLKIHGTIYRDNELKDEVMDFETDKQMIEEHGKDIYFIKKYLGYRVIGKAFLCNISSGYLLNTNKFPIFYMSIVYDKQFVTGFAFHIYAYYKLDAETIKKLNNDPKKYLNTTFKGTLSLEIIRDEDFIEKFVEFQKPKIMEKLIEEYAIEHVNEEITEQCMSNINELCKKKLDEYINLFNPIKLEGYLNKRQIIYKYIFPILNNPLIIDMVDAYIQMKENERKKERQGVYDFTIPKRIFNLAELQKNPNKINEILNDDVSVGTNDSDKTDFSILHEK